MTDRQRQRGQMKASRQKDTERREEREKRRDRQTDRDTQTETTKTDGGRQSQTDRQRSHLVC